MLNKETEKKEIKQGIPWWYVLEEPSSKQFTSCPKAFYRSIYHIKLKQQWTLKTYLWQNIFFKNKNIQSEKRWKVKLVLEHSSPPSPRLSCFPSYEVTRCIIIPLWMGRQSITKLPPPPLKQLLLLGGERERHCES